MTARPHPRPAGLARAATIALGALRVWLGALWFTEGVIKVRAGFDADDIGFVVDGAASSSRVPGLFAWFAEHVMGAAPGLFGVAVPAFDLALGLVLVVGLLPRFAAIASLAMLALFWSADLLIDQYPGMLLLSTAVLAWPATAGRLGVQGWLEARWQRSRRRAAALSAG